jgi:hypothetical protein
MSSTPKYSPRYWNTFSASLVGTILICIIAFSALLYYTIELLDTIENTQSQMEETVRNCEGKALVQCSSLNEFTWAIAPGARIEGLTLEPDAVVLVSRTEYTGVFIIVLNGKVIHSGGSHRVRSGGASTRQ